VSTHYSEDDLTLYYYGESPARRWSTYGAGGSRAAIERHLAECSTCATAYREIAETLAMIVAEEIPERGDRYGLEVWQRVRPQLAAEPDGFKGLKGLQRFPGFAALDRFGFKEFAAAAAVLMIAAFVAGRFSIDVAKPPSPVGANTPTASSASNPPGADAASRRILISSVADHLDRSERVLTDIMNTSNPEDISIEQGWAEDLLSTSRLYRQDAIDAGEQSIATILDDLERNLLEIVHSPSKISAADLEQLRRRIDAAALLFKVRVMSGQLRDREARPADRPTPRTSTSTIS
jgi:hypothetical protein